MNSLMEQCCEKCQHTAENKCKSYIQCRVEGPLCHQDEPCKEKRAAFVAGINIPVGSDKKNILICAGTGCISSGSLKVYDKLAEELEKAGLTDQVKVTATGCHGFCEQGPIFIVEPQHVFYTRVQPEDVAEIVESHLKNGQVVDRLLYHEPSSGQTVLEYNNVNFYARQQREVLHNCGHIDADSIEEYVANGGYLGLTKALSDMSPIDVVEEVKKSGLRGRGGPGFRVPGSPRCSPVCSGA